MLLVHMITANVFVWLSFISNLLSTMFSGGARPSGLLPRPLVPYADEAVPGENEDTEAEAQGQQRKRLREAADDLESVTTSESDNEHHKKQDGQMSWSSFYEEVDRLQKYVNAVVEA